MKNLNKILRKTFTLFLISILLLYSTVPALVIAEEPVPPTAPEAPVVNETPPENPAPPEIPQAPSQTASNDSPNDQSSPSETTDTNNSDNEQNTVQSQEDKDREAKKKAAGEAFIANYHNSTPGSTNPGTGTSSNGNVGDTTLATGNATNNGSSVTTGNNNLQSGNQSAGSATVGSNSHEGASISNSGNGAGSDNSGTSSSIVNNDTNQNNGAQVSNINNQSSTTGTNQSSFNNGNTILNSGDSNTSGTAITAVNTNADGVMVSEFNIADDHKGDIVLTADAYLANCISGCVHPAWVSNIGNGANSSNTANANSTSNSSTFQNNDASIGNNLTLAANSGNNDSSYNTGGNTTINTGDANISANSLTFANNNIAGNVVYGVVNIYGTLEGDIILPEYTVANPSAALTSSNSGNGANSSNATNIATENNNNTFQNNDATITNDLLINAETGNNDSSTNTDGTTTIKTGQTNVDANVLNVVNSNINGGTVWLVLINEAGKWFGQLLGQPEGQNYAGSDGTKFELSPEGQITASHDSGNTNVASNNANGAGSENNTSVSTTNNNTTSQNNDANINNSLNLSANTGGNSTDYNTGGNNIVNTGDANIIANMVNFVNNNIVGNGKLVVTVVNVFGSWLGDFVAPGQQKREKPNQLAQNTNTATNNAESTPNNNTTKVIPTPSVTQTNNGQVAGISQSVQKSITSDFKPNSVNGTKQITYVDGYKDAKTKVAGSNTNKLLADASFKYNSSDKTKAITINLAWLLVLAPIIILIIAGRYIIWSKFITKLRS